MQALFDSTLDTLLQQHKVDLQKASDSYDKDPRGMLLHLESALETANKIKGFYTGQEYDDICNIAFLYHLFGKCYLKLKELPKAMKWFELSRASNELYAPAWFGIAEVYVASAQIAGSDNTKQEDLYQDLHKYSSIINQYIQAINLINSAIKLGFDKYTGFELLGKCYFQIGSFTQSQIQSAQNGIELSSESTRSLQAYITSREDKLGASHKQSTKYFNKARELVPHTPENDQVQIEAPTENINNAPQIAPIMKQYNNFFKSETNRKNSQIEPTVIDLEL